MTAWMTLWMILVVGATRAEAESVIQEFAVPPTVSAPFALKTDSAGRVWFTEKIGKKLIMFNPEAKTFAIHNLPASWEGLGPSRLALGPHGEVWFTVRRSAESEVATNLLGRFDPVKSTFESFPLPDGVNPEALVVDAHGAVWFLNPDGNELGRLQPNDYNASNVPNAPNVKGAERFGLTSTNGNPREIAIDVNGMVWFSLPNINRIGQYDPIGKKFAEYEIPTPFANPGSLATDDKGGIWFVELTSNRIARFSTEQARIDEVEIPTSGGLPIAVVVDAKGLVWFLEYRGNKVGLFDPVLATFREFVIPTFNVQPGDIALDRQQGRLWFSETGTETPQLGLLTIAAALSATDQPNMPNMASAVTMNDHHGFGGMDGTVDKASMGNTTPQPGNQTGAGSKMSAGSEFPEISVQSMLILLVAIGLVAAIAQWAYRKVRS